jgi:hypothetical protein
MAQSQYYDKSGNLITPETPRKVGTGVWLDAEGRWVWPRTEDGTSVHYADFTAEEKALYKRNDTRFACRQPGYTAGDTPVRKASLSESSLMIRVFLASAEFAEVESRTLMFAQQMSLHQGSIVIKSDDVEQLIDLLFGVGLSAEYKTMQKWSKQTVFSFDTLAELNEFIEMARGE